MATVERDDGRAIGDDGSGDPWRILTFDDAGYIEYQIVGQVDDLPVDDGKHLLEEGERSRSFADQVSRNLIKDVATGDWLDFSTIGSEEELA